MVLASRRCTYMATKAGVGMSYHHNPNVAGRVAAQQALQKAGLSTPDFVFVFGSMGYDQHSLVRAVRGATGGVPLTGCSAEGTINGEDADESNFSVVVSAISSDDLHWHNGLATGLEADPRAVGKRVAKELLPHLSTETIGLLVFPDGLKDFIVPTNNLVDNFFAGLEGNLPSERFLPMWGGGANVNINNWAPPTYQYCDDEVITDGVSYALLSGKAQAGWAISHACIPIGGERIVTRSKGNIIYEIDGKPAMEVFGEYIPEGALTHDRDWFRYVISLSLCFRAPSYMKDEEYVVRGMPAVSMPTAPLPFKQKSQKARASGSRAETRRRSPMGSIGWQPRSRISSRVRSPNSSSNSSVPPEANCCSVIRRSCRSSSGFGNP
jgi:hypothetical protein